VIAKRNSLQHYRTVTNGILANPTTVHVVFDAALVSLEEPPVVDLIQSDEISLALFGDCPYPQSPVPILPRYSLAKLLPWKAQNVQCGQLIR
jgi:hypothetical protein